MKKLISLATAIVLLVFLASCSKDDGVADVSREGMEKISIEVESSSGNVIASMWYPTDTGIVFYEGEYESTAFFTDETDGYEMIVELYADNATDFDYLRNDGSLYKPTTLGKYESFLREDEGFLVYYVVLGTKGEETVYLELDVYTLYDDPMPDLIAVMASEEIMAIVDSIEYK